MSALAVLKSLSKRELTIAGTGMAIGALVSWAATTGYYKRRVDGLADTFEEYRHESRRRIDELAREHRESVTIVSPIEEIDETRVDFINETETIPEEAPTFEPAPASPKKNSRLQELIHAYQEDPEGVAPERRDLQMDPAGVVISADEFAYDEEGQTFDKHTLTFYPRHNILLDEDEEVIENRNRVVGPYALRSFGDRSNDSDIVFVRNRGMNTDYEIIRETEDEPPLHIKYGMGKQEFEIGVKAGTIALQPGENV